MMADSGSGNRAAIHGRDRLTCDVAVDPFQRVGGSKREHARKHLVQSDSQRVEIAAGIDRAIHAPGLFRGHVGKGAGDDFRRRRRLALARQSGRDAKSGEPDMAGVVAWFKRDEHVLGLDVFMDQTALVGVAERRRHANRKSQEPRHIECLLPVPIENAVERFAARVGENKNGPSFVACERQRFGRPRRLKFGRERVFVLKASQTLGQRLFRSQEPLPEGACGCRAAGRGKA